MSKTQQRLFVVMVLVNAFSLYGQQNEFQPVANSLAVDIAAAGKKAIAVVDFTDLQGNPTELGRFLAEEFAVAMAKTHKGFQVIDRAHLKTILAEHKLSSTGLIDLATAQKLGQFVGADVLLTGSMTPFSESVRVTVKVLATDTAQIVSADDVDLPKTKTITELLGTAAGRDGKIVDPLPPEGPGSEAGHAGVGGPQSNPIVIANSIAYELVECRGASNLIKCSFRVTNRGPDQDVAHSCGRGVNFSRAFDNFGNESGSESCSIANQVTDRNDVRAHLVSGVTVNASLQFGNVGASASTLSLIDIRAYSFTSGEFHVSFRNVPILR